MKAPDGRVRQTPFLIYNEGLLIGFIENLFRERKVALSQLPALPQCILTP